MLDTKICNLRACLTPKLKEGFNMFKYRLHTISRLRKNFCSVPSCRPRNLRAALQESLDRPLSVPLSARRWANGSDLAPINTVLSPSSSYVWISAQTKALRGPVMLSCEKKKKKKVTRCWASFHRVLGSQTSLTRSFPLPVYQLMVLPGCHRSEKMIGKIILCQKRLTCVSKS